MVTSSSEELIALGSSFADARFGTVGTEEELIGGDDAQELLARKRPAVVLVDGAKAPTVGAEDLQSGNA